MADDMPHDPQDPFSHIRAELEAARQTQGTDPFAHIRAELDAAAQATPEQPDLIARARQPAAADVARAPNELVRVRPSAPESLADMVANEANRAAARLAQGSLTLGSTALRGLQVAGTAGLPGLYPGGPGSNLAGRAAGALERRVEDIEQVLPTRKEGVGALVDMLVRDTPALLTSSFAAGAALPRAVMAGRTLKNAALRGGVLGEAFAVTSGRALEDPTTLVTDPAAFALIETGMGLAGRGLSKGQHSVAREEAARSLERARAANERPFARLKKPPTEHQTREEAFADAMAVVLNKRGAVPARPDPFGMRPDPSTLTPAERRVQQAIRMPTRLRAGAMETLHDIYANVVRGSHALERTTSLIAKGREIRPAEDPTKAMAVTKGSGRRAEEFLRFGPARWDDNGMLVPAGAPSYVKILNMVSGDEAAWNRYRVAVRTLELAESQGKKNLPISVGDADEIIKRTTASGKLPTFEAAHQMAVEYRRALRDYWADVGGLSPEAVKAMDALHANYVDFTRVIEGAKRSASGGSVGRPARQVFKMSREGSELPVQNPIFSDIEATRRMVEGADRQRVGLALVNLAEKFPDDAGLFIKKMETVRTPVPGGADRIIAAAKEAGVTIDKKVAEELAWTLGTTRIKRGGLRGVTRDGRFSVYRNGKLEQWEVLDRNLAKALDNMGPLHFNMLMQILSAPARAFKGGVTLAPPFPVVNLIRDSFDAQIQSQYGFKIIGTREGKLVSDPLFGFLESAKANYLGRPSEQYKRAAQAGFGFATHRGERIRSVKQIARSLSREALPTRTARGIRRAADAVEHPLEALKDLWKPFEEAARIQEFILAEKAGKSTMDALMASQNVSVDFLEHGYGGTVQFFTAVTPFLGPAIQGADLAFRRLAGNPIRATVGAGKSLVRGTPLDDPAKAAAREAAHTYLSALTTVMVPSMILWAANRGDKEIEDIRKTEAGLIYWFYRFPGDREKGLPPRRVAKPFIYGQVFGTGVESVLDKLADDDPEAMSRWAKGVRDQALGLALPHVVNSMLEQWANKDTFFKTPIVNRGQEDIDPAYQTGPNTSTTLRKFTIALDKAGIKHPLLSPPRLEAMWSDTFGTLGRQGLELVDRAIERLDNDGSSKPALERTDRLVRGRFWARQATLNVQPIREFYDGFDAAQSGMATWRANQKDVWQSDPDAAVEWINKPENYERVALWTAYEAVNEQIARQRKSIDLLDDVPDKMMSREQKLDFKIRVQRDIIEMVRQFNELMRAQKENIRASLAEQEAVQRR